MALRGARSILRRNHGGQRLLQPSPSLSRCNGVRCFSDSNSGGKWSGGKGNGGGKGPRGGGRDNRHSGGERDSGGNVEVARDAAELKQKQYDQFDAYLKKTGFKNISAYDNVRDMPNEDIEAAKNDPTLDATYDLGSEYIYNPDTESYFNPKTDDIRVPVDKSLKLYKKRRARYQAKENIEHYTQSRPDYLTEHEHFEKGNSDFLLPSDMERTKHKYRDLNFDAVDQVLRDADSEFFQAEYHPNIIPWGPYVIEEEDTLPELLYEKEMQRFLARLPVKYCIAEFQRNHMTPVGKVMNHGVLVIGGNRKGAISFGYGAGSTPELATRRASVKLRKNMTTIPLDEGRTICQSIVGKFSKTKVDMFRTYRGRGVIAGPTMTALSECLGVRDFVSKIHGNKHPMHVIYAAFKGLMETRHPLDMAIQTGKNYYREDDRCMREKRPNSTTRFNKNNEILATLDRAQHLLQGNSKARREQHK